MIFLVNDLKVPGKAESVWRVEKSMYFGLLQVISPISKMVHPGRTSVLPRLKLIVYQSRSGLL